MTGSRAKAAAYAKRKCGRALFQLKLNGDPEHAPRVVRIGRELARARSHDIASR